MEQLHATSCHESCFPPLASHTMHSFDMLAAAGAPAAEVDAKDVPASFSAFVNERLGQSASVARKALRAFLWEVQHLFSHPGRNLGGATSLFDDLEHLLEAASALSDVIQKALQRRAEATCAPDVLVVNLDEMRELVAVREALGAIDRALDGLVHTQNDTPRAFEELMQRADVHAMKKQLASLFRRWHGYASAKPGQLEAAVLVRLGHDVVMLAQTGGGKGALTTLPHLIELSAGQHGSCVAFAPLRAVIVQTALRAQQLGHLLFPGSPGPWGVRLLGRARGADEAGESDDDDDERDGTAVPTYSLEICAASEELQPTLEGGSSPIVIALAPELLRHNRRAAVGITRLLSSQRVSAFYIDEAHLVSMWGSPGLAGQPAFRAALSDLGSHLKQLMREAEVLASVQPAASCAGAPLTTPRRVPYVLVSGTLADTATVDVATAFHLGADTAFVLTPLFKTNVCLEVWACDPNVGPAEAEMAAATETVRRAIHEYGRVGGKVLLFCLTKMQVLELYGRFEQTISSDDELLCCVDTVIHFAGMADDARAQGAHKLDESKFGSPCPAGRIMLVICTNTMSHGVDAADCVAICHLGLTTTAEMYEQRNGRPGRDPSLVSPGRSVLVAHPSRLSTTFHFASSARGGLAALRPLLHYAYFETGCRHAWVQRQLGDPFGAVNVLPHFCCDNCRHNALAALDAPSSHAHAPGAVLIDVTCALLDFLVDFPAPHLQLPTLAQIVQRCTTKAPTTHTSKCKEWTWLLVIYAVVHEYIVAVERQISAAETAEVCFEDRHTRFAVSTAGRERVRAMALSARGTRARMTLQQEVYDRINLVGGLPHSVSTAV